MTYKVELASSARRSLHRLPPKSASTVLDFIEHALASNPHRVGKPLVDEFEGLWSGRVAEYRVLYAIHEEVVVVEVVRVGHRADIYG